MNGLPALIDAPADFVPVALTPDTPPWTCARQLILERVHEMVKFEAGARQGEDLEALHDMRVWSRRLLEALEIFAFCFQAKVYDRIYGGVRQVTKALGRVREADVAVEYFAKRHAEVQDLEERFALEDLLRHLVEEQERRRMKMQHKLDRKVKTSTLHEEVAAVFLRLRALPASRQRGPRTALRLARTLLLRRLNAVFARRSAIIGEQDVNGLHNLRMDVKKLRYALEILEFAAGENIAANLKFFKKLQSVLGDLHDSDMFIATVRQRYKTRQSKEYSDLLRSGYQKIFVPLAQERHNFYQQYAELFVEAQLPEWRKLVVPPLAVVEKKPARPRRRAPRQPRRKSTRRTSRK
ncbi:MAG: CHAD domain-containing protein [bacterium]